MPRGAAVIPYDGKRGRVWRIKYADATGKQVMETVGAERDGVTRKVAEAELRDRLVKVERRGWRKPAPLTFGDYARTWFEQGAARRGWKPKTVTHVPDASSPARLVTTSGTTRLAEIRPRHVAALHPGRARAGSGRRRRSPRDLAVLHALFKTARPRGAGRREPGRGGRTAEGRSRVGGGSSSPPRCSASRSVHDEQARAVFLTLILTGAPPVRAAGAPLARRRPARRRASGP